MEEEGPAVCAKVVGETLAAGSLVRKAFEEGARLKKERGVENVFDFSIGNPCLEPPESFLKSLATCAASDEPGMHKYMPNPGFPATREAISKVVSKNHEMDVPWQNIIVTAGAAAAMSIVLKTITDPGDETIVIAPYFVEYKFWVRNSGGELVTVHADEAKGFALDVEEIRKAVTPKTRSVIINSPNNPTGAVYTAENLRDLGNMLKDAVESRADKRPIYLLCDEPYRAIVYDGVVVPPVLPFYNYSIVCSSFSKDLGLAGERMGYLSVNPNIPRLPLLLAGLANYQRTLGFVNANALMQRAIIPALGSAVDVDWYKARGKRLHEVLSECGLECPRPKGTFYLFPRIPKGWTDLDFAAYLATRGVLCVAGIAFDGPGHVRFSYCCEMDLIERVAPVLKKAMEELPKK